MDAYKYWTLRKNTFWRAGEGKTMIFEGLEQPTPFRNQGIIDRWSFSHAFLSLYNHVRLGHEWRISM